MFDTITAIRLVKSHAREDHERERFSHVARDNAQAWIGVGHQGTVFSIVTAGLTIVGTTLVLLVGGTAVLDSRITLGTLLLVITYLGYVYGPLAAIANTTGALQQAFASVRRVRAAFAVIPENPDLPGRSRPRGCAARCDSTTSRSVTSSPAAAHACPAANASA